MAIVGDRPISRSLNMISTGRLPRDQVFEVARADGAAQPADDARGVVVWAVDEVGLSVATEGDGALPRPWPEVVPRAAKSGAGSKPSVRAYSTARCPSVPRRSFVLYVLDFDHDGTAKGVVGVDI